MGSRCKFCAGVRAAIVWAGRLLVTAGAFCVFLIPLLARPAVAQQTDCVTIDWAPAAGSVVAYDVYVEINGGQLLYHSRVDEAEATVGGPRFALGDALRFQVIAVGADGRRSPSSEFSDVMFCLSVPVPEALVAVDGSARHPILLSWNSSAPVEYYVIFRSTELGVNGAYLDRSDGSLYQDDTATLDVEHYYSVVAVAGRQISGFSAQIAATRGGQTPELIASDTQLVYVAQTNETTGRQSLELSNAGDWELAYRAWSGAVWLQAAPSAGILERGEADQLEFSYQIDTLPEGDHFATVLIYSYFDPSPGEELAVGQPIAIQVKLIVPPKNLPPVIESATIVAVPEGTVLVAPLRATDPDAADLVRLGVLSVLPSWAVFEELGGGEGRLTLTPDYEAAGTTTLVLVAWDTHVPSNVTSEIFTIVVDNVNRSPVAAPIANRRVWVGETETVLISAFDPDLGDRMAIATSTLPAFASFIDFGNGTAQVRFEPEHSDVGSYLLLVVVVDDGVPSGVVNLSFQLTVED